MRLNKGIRGRLQDRLFQLMDKKQMKGYDVNYIYENTKGMYEGQISEASSGDQDSLDPDQAKTDEG